MPNSLKITRFRLYLALCLFFTLSANSLLAADDTLDKLMAPLQNDKSITLRFEETRTSYFFKQPRISIGILQITKPDTMIKTVFVPSYQQLRIEGNKVTINQDEKGDVTKTVNLSSYPELAEWISTLKALLSGDTAVLKHYYKWRRELNDDKEVIIFSPVTRDRLLNPPGTSEKTVVLTLFNNEVESISIGDGEAEKMVFRVTEIIERLQIQQN